MTTHMVQNRVRHQILSILLLLLISLTAGAGVDWIFPPTAEAAVATDGTDDGVRPPAEEPPEEEPPVTVRPPSPPSRPSGPAVSITEVRVRNEDKEGNALSDFKVSFDFDETRWISYYVRLVNNTDDRLQGKLGVRYIQPDGKLKQNSKSPAGFTFEQNVTLVNSREITGGWGKAAGGSFEPGRHRIEFWWNGQRIHQVTFAVNAQESPLRITALKLRNEMKDGTPLSDYGWSFERDEIQYITFYATLANTTAQPQKGRMSVKFIKPDGTLMQGSKSPNGFTFDQDVNVVNSASVTNGWGRSTGGSYEPGRYRIEFWWDGKRIGQTLFTVK